MEGSNPDRRGISPVIGVTLLVAVVVTLAAVSGAMLFSLSEEPEPAPDVALTMESGDGPAAHVIKHEGGDELDGEQVELRGAADSEALSGTDLSAGDGEQVHATDETVEVVWQGEDGTSYVLRTFEVGSDETVPDPDEGCAWVEDESDDGTQAVTVDAITVDCDVTTSEDVKIQNGGVVIGEAISDTKTIDGDEAVVYGDAEADNVVDFQDSRVTGSVASTENVKLGNSTVDDSVDAVDQIEVQSGSSVGGDATSDDNVKVTGGSTVSGDVSSGNLAKVLDSEVSGSVVSTDSVKLDGATIEDDVYVDSADFDCTDTTINGQDCDDYTPKDPDDY